MPVVLVALWFAPLLIATPIAMEENKKEQQVNQICVDKFKTTEEIKACKQILMKVGQ